MANILEQKTVYQIGEKISKGGTGIIYAAQKLDGAGKPDGIRYAVKEIGEAYSGIAKREKETSQKIENEAKYNICIPILDDIHMQGKEYLVMQLKRHGMFLNEMIEEIRNETQKSHAVPFVHIKGVLSAVLAGLSLLHNCMPDGSGYCGFLHLDLHPGNIFMENADWKNQSYGTAKFIDLQNAMGIPSNGPAYMESKNRPIGITRGFCAPELINRDYNSISAKTDLYSVAAILLDMLGVSCQTYNLEETTDILKEMGVAPAARIQIQKFLENGLSRHAINRFDDAAQMLECLEQAWKFQELYTSGDYYALYQLVYKSGLAGRNFRESSNTASAKGFLDSVRALDSALHQNKYNSSECCYIYQRLEGLYRGHTGIADTETLAMLYSSGLASYNHFADNKKCVEISGKLLALKNRLPVMAWASILNRVAVQYADVFQMDKAMQILEGNIQNLERVKSAYSSIASAEGMEPGAAKLADLGRAYSAYATYMAYTGSGNPMAYFEKALQEFNPGNGNSSITVSHILHYAVTVEFPFFDKWYRMLSGGKGLLEHDEIRGFIDLENEKKDIFHLWIYMKAIYVFELYGKINYLKGRVLELLGFMEDYKENPFPSAMVLKYCGLLLYKLDRENYRKDADTALKRAIRKLENGVRKERGELTLFKVIAYHIQSEAYLISENTNAAAKLYEEFMGKLDGSLFYQLKDWMEHCNKDREIPEIMLKGEYF